MSTPENQSDVLSTRLVKRISDFLQQLDIVFATIAGQLPSQLSRVEAAVGQLAGDGITRSTQTIHQRLNDLQTCKAEMHGQIQSGFERFESELAVSRQAVAHIQEYAAHIENRCDDLNLFALNTRLATTQSHGGSAATFRAITLELTERSRSIVQLAGDLRQRISEAVEQFAAVQNNHTDLNSTLDELTEKQINTVAEGKTHWAKTTEELSMISARATDLIAQLRPHVQHVMVHIQEQDIIRQSLIHIHKVLLESSAMTHINSQEKALFIQQAYDLSAILLSESKSQLEQFIATTAGGLSELSLLGEHIQQLKQIENRHEELRKHLLTPIDLLSQQTALMSSLLDALGDIDNRWQQMRQQLKGTSVTGNEIKNITSDLSLLEVSMRINGSNDPELECETTALATDFRTIHSTIRAALKEIVRLNLDIQGQTISLDLSLQLNERQKHLREDIVRLNQTATEAMDEFLAQIQSSIWAGEEMAQFSEELQRSLSSLMTQFPEPEEIAEVIQAANAYASKLSTAGPDSPVGLSSSQAEVAATTSKHLENLISEFAVFTQKIAAGQLLEMDIEQGDTEGELTLF